MAGSRHRTRRRHVATLWAAVTLAWGAALAGGWWYLGEARPLVVAATTAVALVVGSLATKRLRGRDRERTIPVRELWRR